MNTNINLIEEELEEDLVHTVIDSLRNHHTDYCFSNKDFKSILSLAKEAGIGLIYKVFYDRYDKLDDHIHFICMRCNKIFDIYDYSLKINEDLKGKKVLNPKIILEGICEKCQKKEEI